MNIVKAMTSFNDESTCKSDESASVQLSNSDSDKEDSFFAVNLFRVKMNHLRTASMVIVANTNKTQKQTWTD